MERDCVTQYFTDRPVAFFRSPPMYFNATGLTSRRHDAEGAFVHVSAVEQSGLTGLADNQAIEFDLIEGREGRQMAGNLRKG